MRNNIITRESLAAALGSGKSYDMLYRDIEIGGDTAGIFFIDGFIKDAVTEKIFEYFFSIKSEDMPDTAEDFALKCVPYGEVDTVDTLDDAVFSVQSGALAVVFDSFESAVIIDTRTYPQRDTSEPDKDKTFRGSRDGFVETIVFNTALVRRRIRSNNLLAEAHRVGHSSKTDVVVMFMDDRVDKKLLSRVRQVLDGAHVDALSMNQESLAELFIKKKWYNPFPKFKYTERPDTAAAQLLEGDIVLFCDNSPSAMILPVCLLDIAEEANDYYFPPITGSYLRLTRFLALLVTLLLTPLFLLAVTYPESVPETLKFIIPEETPAVPYFIQLLILELAIDGLKLAAMNTPDMLTTTLGVIGAIVVSDFAVDSGWFTKEIMLYMAIVSIGNYSQPEYELGYALKFMRILLLVITAAFGIYGFIAGIILVLLILCFNKTVSGKSYLYPLIPLDLRQLKKKLLRTRQ